MAWFEEKTTEGILLVDAFNAFKSLNCQAALQNLKHLCSPLAPIQINCYSEPSPLSVGVHSDL